MAHRPRPCYDDEDGALAKASPMAHKEPAKAPCASADTYDANRGFLLITVRVLTPTDSMPLFG